MYEIYNLVNYEVKKNQEGQFNIKSYTNRIEEICKKLEETKGYHTRLKKTDNVILFGDLDGYTKDIEEFKNEMKYFLERKGLILDLENDFKYTKNHGYKKEGSSYHYSIPKYNGKMENIKKLILEFQKKNNYGKSIDISIYCDKWWRLPNQLKSSEANTEHRIIKGEMKDFIVQYIGENSKNIDEIIISLDENSVDKTINLYELTINNNSIDKTENLYIKDTDNNSIISEITNSTINEERNKNKIDIKILKKYLNGLKDTRSEEYEGWTHVVWGIANICKDNKWNSKIRNELIHEFSKKDKHNYNELKVDEFIDKSIKEDKGGINLGSIIRWYKMDNNIEEDDEELYLKYKKEHDEECFKLNNPVVYGRINDDQDSIQLMKEKDMVLYLKDKGYVFKNIKKTFYEIWSNDKTKRKYEKIIFDPFDKTNKNLNLFHGFKYEYENEEIKILDTSKCKLIILINHLCNYEETTISNLKDWISRIIQHPERKTEWAIVLFSIIGGIGKNGFIDYINVIFEGYVGKVENIEQLIDRFNSSICNKLIIYGDEINAGAKKIADQLKSIITRKKIKMEKKNIDSIDLNDFTNYIFSTNNEHCFKIENGDRRYFMIKCPDYKLTDEFFIELYQEMKDEEIIKQIFHYFKTRDILYKKNTAPETEYKIQLIYEQLPSYINMIYTNVDLYSSQKISTNSIYESSKEYGKKKYLSTNYTSQTFSKDFKNMFNEYYIKSNGISYYNFPNQKILQNKLYELNPKYYRYINNFDENEEIIF
jgi:hypothetical protein